MSNNVALNILWTVAPTLGRQTQSDSSIVCKTCQQLGTDHQVPIGTKATSRDCLRIPIHLASLPDEALLVHVREGCIDAMGVLFDRHYPLVSAVAFKMLRDQNQVQVIVEEVFYEVFLKAKEFDCKKARVKEWFVRSAYVRSMNRRRLISIAEGVDSGSSELLWETANPATELGRKLTALSEREQTRLFRNARKRLSKKQRTVLELSIFDFLTCDEIAVRTETTRDEARALLYEALLVMREECQSALDE